MSPYGGMGGYGSYASPMNRMGMGGGYGGYGGYGTGMGGYGVGGMGGPGEVSLLPPSPFPDRLLTGMAQAYPTLTSSMQATTAPAFAVLESLVTAFTSLAQLVESTYMATHSSFFAMVGVADQLGSLKTYLGQVLGVFSVLRLGRRLVNWLKGRHAHASTAGWATEWAGGGGVGGGAGEAARPSSKPLLLFLLSAVGLPWLMSRLVKLLIATTQQQNALGGMGADGAIDPSKLTFARARWEFRPSEEWELGLARDEIVAVLEMRDGGKDGEPSGWWRGRTRDGRVGWFPANHVRLPRRGTGWSQADGVRAGGCHQEKGGRQRECHSAMMQLLPGAGSQHTINTADRCVTKRVRGCTDHIIGMPPRCGALRCSATGLALLRSLVAW